MRERDGTCSFQELDPMKEQGMILSAALMSYRRVSTNGDMDESWETRNLVLSNSGSCFFLLPVTFSHRLEPETVRAATREFASAVLKRDVTRRRSWEPQGHLRVETPLLRVSIGPLPVPSIQLGP